VSRFFDEPDGGDAMPFVNITIYEGHGKDRKDEIAYVAGDPGTK
jgi:hypothetical protein